MFASRAARNLWTFSLATLVFLCCLNLWPRIYGIPRLSSLTYPEGWNAYHTATILKGAKPYGAPTGLAVANYPPLFWELVAVLGRDPSSLVTTGRVVSLIALFSMASLAGLIAFKVSGSKSIGILASLLLLTWMSSVAGGYLATNEPQILAEALASAGLLAYLAFGNSARGLLAASGLFCLAMFVKNNVIAVPLAVSLHVLWSSWRHFLRWVLFNACFALLLFTAVWVHNGSYFLQCLLTPRSYSFAEVLHGTRAFTDAFQVPLVVAVLWCVYNFRVSGRVLFAGILVISLAIGMGFRGGGGTNLNMFFDAIIGLALICPLALADLVQAFGARPVAGTLLALSPLWLCVWPLTRLGPSAFTAALHAPAIAAAGEHEYMASVDLLKAHPGPAICETMRLCFDAGKPLVYDPYYVRELVKIGRLQESEIARSIEQEHYSAIQFDDLFDSPPGAPGRVFFSGELLKVIQQYYTVALTTSSYVLLVPKTNPNAPR